MNFGFTEEQDLLRAEVRKFLDKNAPLEEVRKWVETPEGYSPGLWLQMAELGWVGLTAPEAHGGAELDLVTLVVLLEETGRTLCPSPLISNALAAKAIELAGTEDQKTRWLPELARGSKIGTLAALEANEPLGPGGIRMAGVASGDSVCLNGSKCHVQDAGCADVFVVVFRLPEDGLGFALVERGQEGVSVASHSAMDPSKSTGTVAFNGVTVGADDILPSGSGDVFAHLLDLGAMMVTAETVGAAEGAHAITSQFAKEREQFDRVIGAYQGVKHPLAEMFVDIESFKSLVYYAAWALDEGAEDASMAASRAKAYASDVFPRIGIDCVQLHGGVGYTWEYDIQLYLKRSKWLRPTFGDADYHYERIAALGGL